MATLHEDGFYWSHSKFTYRGEEQLTNVRYITAYLRGKGWTDNAIAGVLGNMQSESGINPGAYYGYVEYSAVSFGVVQWDPTSKYRKWHDANYPNEIYEHLGCQLERLLYELENRIQFYSTSEFPMSFKTFSTSKEGPGYLAKAFVRNYERPASILYDPDKETLAEHEEKKAKTYNQRAKQAENWYAYITGQEWPYPESPEDSEGQEPGYTPTPGKGLSVLDTILYTRRRRIHVVR